jgi:hypothetical protein
MLPDLAASDVDDIKELEWCLGATKAAAASLMWRVNVQRSKVNSKGAAKSCGAEEWGDFIVSFLCIR